MTHLPCVNPNFMMTASEARGLTVLLFFSFAFSAFIPSLAQKINITSTTGLTIPDSGSYECIKATLFMDKRPPFLDCRRAIQLLPQSNTIGIFHISGEPDVFELPTYAINGGCKLTVDINKYYLSDVDSWFGIRSAASELNYACRDTRVDPWRTGGWLMTGEYGKIKISLTEIAEENAMGKDTVAIQKLNTSGIAIEGMARSS